jgi:multidrug efflux pump subunit AcrA (membrane-fusion protein)
VVDYDPLVTVRAESPGFVRTLHVAAGQLVAAGTCLATIDNPTSVHDLLDVDLAIQQSALRARIMQGESDYTSLQVERTHRESLESQRSELAARVATLRPTAAIAGRIIGRDLQGLVGRYLHTGDELLAIGADEHKSIVVAVPQHEVEFFLRQVGTEARVRILGQGERIRGARLAKVDPRASDQIPHAALAAGNGGPLPVAQIADGIQDGQSGPLTRLVEPHFRATIELPAEQARRLRAGQVAQVRLGSAGHSIGAHIRRWIEEWMRAKLGSL